MHRIMLSTRYNSRYKCRVVKTQHRGVRRGRNKFQVQISFSRFIFAKFWIQHDESRENSFKILQSWCKTSYGNFHIQTCSPCTGWRRPIGCLKLQVIFRKRATNYRALLREMTYTDKASCGSEPPFSKEQIKNVTMFPLQPGSFTCNVTHSHVTWLIHTWHVSFTGWYLTHGPLPRPEI